MNSASHNNETNNKPRAINLTNMLFSPPQWEGTLTDGRFFYIHYGRGLLTVGFGTTLDEAIENSGNEPKAELVELVELIGDDDYHYLSEEKMKIYTNSIIDWSIVSKTTLEQLMGSGANHSPPGLSVAIE